MVGAVSPRLFWPGVVGQGATRTARGPCRCGRAESLTCGEPDAVIVVLDEAQADREATSGGMRCAGCGGSLRPWGYARPRKLRGPDGTTVPLRPRRVRCRPCRSSHVLLPAWAPARRADTIEVIGAGLLAIAGGASDRTAAAELSVPAATVRAWRRRVTRRADQLRGVAWCWALECDPLAQVPEPTGSQLGDLVCVLGLAAAAITRRLGVAATAAPWRLIAALTRGQLLAPLPDH